MTLIIIAIMAATYIIIINRTSKYKAMELIIEDEIKERSNHLKSIMKIDEKQKNKMECINNKLIDSMKSNIKDYKS